MSSEKTVKYHVPNQGLYVYARSNEGKREVIVLNSTDNEQVLVNAHIQTLVKDRTHGRELSSGTTINFNEDIVVPAHKSMIIEC